MYEEREFLKHEKAACQKTPSTHSYTEYTGLLGTFSWGHTHQNLKPELHTQSWILALCTAINRSSTGRDLRALSCTPGASLPRAAWVTQPYQANTAHCWSHCQHLNGVPLQNVQQPHVGYTDQDKGQASWYFTALCYFLSTDLLEMHHTVTWNPFSHNGHAASPINCFHTDMHF